MNNDIKCVIPNRTNQVPVPLICPLTLSRVLKRTPDGKLFYCKGRMQVSDNMARYILVINNYSPKWRWLAVDIYRAAKRRGKYNNNL